MSHFSRIAGTGGYLPEKILTNQQISEQIDTSDEWIVERTGIRRRHIAADDQTTTDLAEKAARQAIEAAGISPQVIDLVIVTTGLPETIYPSTACRLQQRLGIPRAAAFDLQAACTGFIYALSVADQFIRAGNKTCVLVVGSEINSRLVDWSDRSTCILFGDGAGAVILEAASEPGILSTHIHSDGRYQDMLYVPNPVGKPMDTDPAYIHMRGNEVFKVAVNTLGEIADQTLAANNMDKSEIDWLVPHQANIRILRATAKKLKLPLERVVMTIEDQGNTSSASVALALNEAVRDNRIQRGQTVLMEAFGGGFVWGSALLKF